MVLSLDYDDTYTEDPEFWLDFISRCKLRGHKIYCVTMRDDTTAQLIDPRLHQSVTIFATCGQAKKAYCEARGIRIDIWIDDHPEWIGKSLWEEKDV